MTLSPCSIIERKISFRRWSKDGRRSEPLRMHRKRDFKGNCVFSPGRAISPNFIILWRSTCCCFKTFIALIVSLLSTGKIRTGERDNNDVTQQRLYFLISKVPYTHDLATETGRANKRKRPRTRCILLYIYIYCCFSVSFVCELTKQKEKKIIAEETGNLRALCIHIIWARLMCSRGYTYLCV